MSEENCTNTEEDKTPGIFSWRELVTQDPEASAKFYSELLGWTTDTMEMPNGMNYTMFMNGKQPVAGMMKPPGPAPTSWLDYITVADLDATVEKATSLGASTCVPAMKIPEKGRFAVIIDPQGAAIAFWEFLD